MGGTCWVGRYCERTSMKIYLTISYWIRNSQVLIVSIYKELVVGIRQVRSSWKINYDFPKTSEHCWIGPKNSDTHYNWVSEVISVSDQKLTNRSSVYSLPNNRISINDTRWYRQHSIRLDEKENVTKDEGINIWGIPQCRSVTWDLSNLDCNLSAVLHQFPKYTERLLREDNLTIKDPHFNYLQHCLETWHLSQD